MVKLADIPPMQYFSIVRAAKLLSLEIDDLAHLWEIGVIWPMIRFENYQKGTLFVTKYGLNEALDSHNYCRFLPQSGIGVVSCLLLDDNFDRLADCDMRELYLQKLYPYEGDTPRPVTAYISGYWMVTKFHVNFRNGVAQSLSVDSVESISLEESEYSFKNYSFEVDVDLKDVPFHDTFISRENVLRIRDAMLKGDVLDSTYVLERGYIQKYSPVTQGNEKQTYKQAAMIKGLLRLMPGVDEVLLSSPHKLHTKLDQLFRDAGVTYPVSDGKTLKDWLEKAKS